MNFDQAFEKLIGHEGGYVQDVRDPGGETKFGVSKRSYPSEDIKNLTLDRAKFLYRRDFWGPCGAEIAPDYLKYPLFDLAVNSGPNVAVTMLQRIVGEVQDGAFGPRTLAAVQCMPAPRLIARFAAARIEFLTDRPTWPAFGKGWMRRVAAELKEA